MKGCAPGLALEKRHKTTRKWTIDKQVNPGGGGYSMNFLGGCAAGILGTLPYPSLETKKSLPYTSHRGLISMLD